MTNCWVVKKRSPLPHTYFTPCNHSSRFQFLNPRARDKWRLSPAVRNGRVPEKCVAIFISCTHIPFYC